MSSGLTKAGDYDCKLPIVPMKVKSKNGSKIITIYAFLDQGSTASTKKYALMHRLGVTGKKAHILLRTVAPGRFNPPLHYYNKFVLLKEHILFQINVFWLTCSV